MDGGKLDFKLLFGSKM